MAALSHGIEKYGTDGLLASSADRGWSGLSAELRSHGLNVGQCWFMAVFMPPTNVPLMNSASPSWQTRDCSRYGAPKNTAYLKDAHEAKQQST